MKETSRSTILTWVSLFAIAFLFTWFHRNNFFFWDNVIQISAPANWYYDNNFSKLLVPDVIATGHPPLVPLYIAAVWTLFGKSLVVSNLAMLPFRFGILVQIESLLRLSGLNRMKRIAVMILVMVNPVFLSQYSLITIELPSLFFFLLIFNSFLSGNKNLLALGFSLLCLTSIRGVIAGIGFVIFSVAEARRKGGTSYLGAIKPYLPGGLLLVLFFVLFYLDKGWLIHNVNSGRWSESASVADIRDLFRNIVILIWRLGDYGNFVLWVFPFLLIKKTSTQKFVPPGFIQMTAFLAFIQLSVLIPFTIPFNNPFGHRYFLPVFLVLTLVTGVWIFSFLKRPAAIYSVVLIILITGNLWVYPKNISQGWDSTAAHWGYYESRRELVSTIKKRYGGELSVGTFFPNIEGSRWVDLSEDGVSFKSAEMEKDNYLFYSNVFNVPDGVTEDLENKEVWKQVASSKSGFIKCILYSRE